MFSMCLISRWDYAIPNVCAESSIAWAELELSFELELLLDDPELSEDVDFFFFFFLSCLWDLASFFFPFVGFFFCVGAPHCLLSLAQPLETTKWRLHQLCFPLLRDPI